MELLFLFGFIFGCWAFYEGCKLTERGDIRGGLLIIYGLPCALGGLACLIFVFIK